MNITTFLSNPYKRIEATHFLVIFILAINIFFFTEHIVSTTLQVVLMIAVFFHNRDDKTIKKKLEEVQYNLREDSNIFDRNIIVSESDLNGVITYVNTNFIEISGYSREELIGKPHSLLRHPDMPKKFFQELWSTLKDEKTFHGIFKNMRKDKTPYWVDASISPIKRAGKIIGYKAICFDITDKMIAKETYKREITQKDHLIEEQSNRFEFAINSSRDGFWDLDLVKKEFYLSSGWKKRLGFKDDAKLTYLDYLSLIPDEFRVEHHNAMHEVIENYPHDLDYVHFRVKYPLVTQAGEKLFIEDVGDAFFNADKKLIRITGFHRDITEQVRQSKMIESQNRVAAMGDMIGNIAHQWRQPIGAINNALNDLEFDIELEDLESIESKKFLEVSQKVKSYTNHLSETINDFRKLTSDEKVKSQFMLIEVLDEAHSIVKDSFDKHAIDFSIELKKECKCVFTGYRRELLQVIINIFNNAKDIFLEKNIENPKLKVQLNRDDANVYMKICDNAGGVPQEIIEKIFDPYFTTKHESVGTGIGLFMSQKMIREHFKGTLSVENENDGAVFTIALPRQKN